MAAAPPTLPQGVRRTRLLRPRLTDDLVARRRLVERLNAGLDRSLLLLSTPAGFGKTTLLCEWLAQTAYPSAWLSLDEQGEDLAGFVTHLVGAIQGTHPVAGRETLGLLRLPDPASPSSLAATLADELLDLPDDLIAVLDDYHLVDDPRVHQFLSAFLEHPPPTVHLAIATRTDPPLPLARLRMRGQVCELRAPDLRFSPAETAAFFAGAAEIELDAGTAGLLEERAEGWAAGLRLASLSLQGRRGTEDVLTAFEGRRLRGVMDFLSDEVLNQQREPVRAFLLHTSIVERLCAPLCEALMGGDGEESGDEMLERVAQANLYLVPLGDPAPAEGPRWYRYHHLFRDVLRDRLRAGLGSGFVAELHARASAWFADNALIEDAVRHALAARDPSGAALIVERNVHPALDRRPG